MTTQTLALPEVVHRPAPRRRRPVRRPPPIRELLGFSVLLLVVGMAYVSSRAPEPTPQITADTETETRIDEFITAAAERHGVPENLVIAIIAIESRFDTHAVSRRGARGLMQLMPATAAALGVRDSFDPEENIDGGVREVRRLMNRFGNNLPLVLAAYNAGEQAVIQHGGIPPYRETRTYVARVIRRMNADRNRAMQGTAVTRLGFPR
ncbi:MAG TPA: lytic transglycosylase domain-containing protein [Methylomirabilota bacterium]|jgi:soluble lytic murein transglycosylase-like protein